MGAIVNSGIGFYEATSRTVKTSFDLLHKGVPIFERYFNGQSESVVGIGTSISTISIPNHNFVTGEEVIYDYSFDFLHRPIGIVTTNIPGIGITDILPSKLYIIKLDAQYIRFAAAPEDATIENPKFLQITSVGIGTLHKISSIDPDSRLLLTIDNVIQSPIVGTGITSHLLDNLTTVTDIVGLSTTKNLFNGDLIKINDEIMEVRTVGFTSSNYLLVRRPVMGSSLGIHSIGDTVEKLSGNYTVNDNTVHFASAPFGIRPIGTGTTVGSPLSDYDYSGINTSSKFSGRCFIRSGIPGDTKKTYSDNYIFDDISENFSGLQTNFTLKVGDEDVSGFDLDSAVILVRDVFQSPKVESNVTISGNYEIKSGTSSTSIEMDFIGLKDFSADDINSSGVPIGGIIASVGSSSGFGYQKLKQAGGSATLNLDGSIASVEVSDGGSGYRPTIQSPINVYARTGDYTNDFIVKIGEAVVGTSIEDSGKIVSVNITNPGSGYSEIENPPSIIFDKPLNYTSIPLVYSSSSQPGVGTGAKANIIVGQGSSVISFELSEYGYGYKTGDILTLPLGFQNNGIEGLVDYVYTTIGVGTAIAPGITTTFSSPLVIDDGVTVLVNETSTVIIGDNVYRSIVEEFQIYVDRTYSDKFSSWSFGELEVFDSPEALFDGARVTFPLTVDGVLKSIIGDSSIDIQSALLVFLNGILQVPGEGYIFDGGSTFTFTEAPNGPLEGTVNTGDNCQVLFYRGTKNIDVIDVDVTETIKTGDFVQIFGEEDRLRQENRLVHLIDSTSSLISNIYAGVGIVSDISLKRTLNWTKQSDDLFILGEEVTKDRPLYEARINPFTNIIQNVGTAVSTSIYVEGAKTYFDNYREDITGEISSTIEIVDILDISRASLTAEVSNSGIVDNLVINDPGTGYQNGNVNLIISPPVGLGTTSQAKGYAIASNGSITSFVITDGGIGYNRTSPPDVFVEKPVSVRETITDVSYTGDFGVLTGIAVTTIGIGSTGLLFNLYVPEGSVIRDQAVTGIAITVSNLSKGDYFTLKNTYFGNGITSLDLDGNIIGVSTSFLDNIYQVYDVSYQRKVFTVTDSITGFEIFNSPGIIEEGVVITVEDGATLLIDEFSTTEVIVRVEDVYPEISAIQPALDLGNYSWGRIDTIRRRSPSQFKSLYENGMEGIPSSPIVRRVKPLNYFNYVS